jgi:MFS family permease
VPFAALARPGLFAAAARHRDYRLYVIGNTISLPGNWLQSAAQAWLVLSLTHSAAAVGSVTFWTFLPYATVGLAAGPVADVLNPRHVLVATQAALAAAAVLLAVVSTTSHADMLVMDLIAAFRGCALVLNNPARQVLLVRIVGRQDLKSALSLNSAVSNAGRVAGPAVSGVLMAQAGISVCFWLNAASFLPLIAAIALIRPRPGPVARRMRLSRTAADLLAGLRYAAHHRSMWLAAGLLAVAAVFTINFPVLLPVYTAQVLHAGPSVYGALYSLLGLGSLFGAVTASASKTARWGSLLTAAAVFGIGEIALGIFPNTAAACAAVLLTGAGYSAYTTTTSTMMQLSAPDEMQGRAGALYSYIFTGSNPVTSVLMGDLAQASTAAAAFSAGGIALCTATAGACLLLHLTKPLPAQTPAGQEPGNRPGSSRPADG